MNPLRKLIQEEMDAQHIKRSELSKRMGYKNISKGLRRVDALLDTLEGSEKFLPLLQQALSIPDDKLQTAVSELQEQIMAAERALFKPVIQVIPTRRPSPIFVAALVPKLLNIEVPENLSSLPLEQEMEIVCDLYRKHRAEYQGWAKGKGIVYHRSYDESFEFDQDCRLVKHNERHVGLSRAVLTIGGSVAQMHFEIAENDQSEVRGKPRGRR